MVSNRGRGFIGSNAILVSTGNQDLIPVNNLNYPYTKCVLYKMSFLNKQPCHIIINDSDPIFVDMEQGFESDERDTLIEKFIIVEAGIEYQFIGAY